LQGAHAAPSHADPSAPPLSAGIDGQFDTSQDLSVQLASMQLELQVRALPT